LRPSVALWMRVAAVTAAAIALTFSLTPARPSAQLPRSAAIPVGAAAGLVLFVAIARSRPRLPTAAGSVPVLLAKVGFFGLWATNEELLWRRVALGEMLGAGAIPAVVGSTLGFAFVHRARRGLHVFTGGAFGAVYLATGVLAASVAAHVVYNLLVAALVDRDLRRAHGPPA
jgi:membrane protease YdiL (CAAX protease family)